jgi:hypothetical protein
MLSFVCLHHANGGSGFAEHDINAGQCGVRQTARVAHFGIHHPRVQTAITLVGPIQQVVRLQRLDV